MTDQEILHKAIVQAEKNGYNSEAGLSLVTLTRNAIKPRTEGGITGISLDLEYLELNVFIPYIIFGHDFAKAFWGNKKIRYCISEYANKQFKALDKVGVFDEYCWQYHLQKMILEKEPLKYLEKFL